jgi:CubicO group peptidase (beta-lactamase class C family)
MTRLLFAVVLVALTGVARADAIDDYINTEIERQHVPGLALAIMQHGHLLRAQGYGFANLEHHVPVHPDTVFQTGSVGMQFTAVAILLLVEDGKLRLDDPIRTYLPAAPRTWAPITLRQLLNHTSGLPTTPSGEFRRDYTDDELLAILYKQELNFPAGTHWSFSYAGYLVLGMTIKKATGESYADLLTRRVFAPLGMRTTRLMDYLAIIPNRAAGYELADGQLRNQEWVSPTANSTADGALVFSALDYALWDSAIVGHKILRPQSWAEVAEPARLPNGHTYPYGFGWFLGHTAGQEVWSQAGSWQGFQTFVIRYLGEELTIIAMANSNHADPTTLVRHVAAMLDPSLAQPPGAPIEDPDPRLTQHLSTVLQQIAAGKPNYTDFAFISRSEFAETMADNQKTLQSLGAARQLALFAQKQLGDEQVLTYRVRYDNALLDVILSRSVTGEISKLEFKRVADWDTPTQE